MCRNHASLFKAEVALIEDEEGVAFGAYGGVLAEVIQAVKFRGISAVQSELAGVLPARPESIAPGTVLVPIPISRKRLSKRGFNQAKVIAQVLGRAWDLPVCNALTRLDSHESQIGKGREQRLHAEHRFRVRGKLPASEIILVDDVRTTGATLEAAKLALGATAMARYLVLAQA